MRNFAYILFAMLLFTLDAEACNCGKCDFGDLCCVCNDYDFIIACPSCTPKARDPEIRPQPEPRADPEPVRVLVPAPQVPTAPTFMPRLILSRLTAPSPRGSPRTSRTASPGSGGSRSGGSRNASPKGLSSIPTSPQSDRARRCGTSSSDAEIDDSN